MPGHGDPEEELKRQLERRIASYNDVVSAIRSMLARTLNIIIILHDSQPLPVPVQGLVLVNGNGAAVVERSTLSNAFIHANKIFNQFSKDQGELRIDDLIDASNVALLNHPEHITAANIRRRLIIEFSKRSFVNQLPGKFEVLKGYEVSEDFEVHALPPRDPISAAIAARLDPLACHPKPLMPESLASWANDESNIDYTPATPAKFEEFIRREQKLTYLLLVSPLKKNAKLPTLWSYRQWLMRIMLSLGFSTTGLVLRELRGVVRKAADRQPMNYYAWSYMRWLVSLDRIAEMNERPKGSVIFKKPKTAADGQYIRNPTFVPSRTGTIGTIMSKWVYKTVVEEMVTWCLSHHTDISGWSFLTYLIAPKPLGAAPLFDSEHKDIIYVMNEKFRQILDSTKEKLWKNEAVWVFLRTMAISEHTTDELRNTFIQTIKRIVEDRSMAGDRDFKHLNAADDWYTENRPTREEGLFP